MKTISTLLLLWCFSGCAVADKDLDISFYDSHGESYPINNASMTIMDRYNLSEAPKIVVLATSEENNDDFKKQLFVFSQVNAEDMQYLYIVANASEEDRSGYYMDKIRSIKLLSGSEFKVIVYDENGLVLVERNSYLSACELIGYLKDKKLDETCG